MSSNRENPTISTRETLWLEQQFERLTAALWLGQHFADPFHVKPMAFPTVFFTISIMGMMENPVMYIYNYMFMAFHIISMMIYHCLTLLAPVIK